MKKAGREIFSSCCAIGSDGSEEVHVLRSVCPIVREEEQRIVKPIFKQENERAECTCICFSAGSGMNTPPCKYYGVATLKIAKADSKERV